MVKPSLRVLHINDIYELEFLPRFATCVKEYVARGREEGCQTVVMLPGDFVAPSLLSSLDHAYGMVDCLNRCGLQYVCLGNHETDIPHRELLRRIEESKFKWINTNMPEFNAGHLGKLPTHDVFTVNDAWGVARRVGVLGLLTEDPGLYRPGSFAGATIQAVRECAEQYLSLYESEKLDLIIPMTHQVIAHDREFAQHFAGKFPGGVNQNAYPLIVGGHDHEPYQEEVAGACLLKTGCDAKSVGVSEVTWPVEGGGEVRVATELHDMANFAPDPELEAVVRKHVEALVELDSAPLFVCEEGVQLSSKDNRIKPTTLCTKLVSSLRDAMGSDGCILNAGNIRGNRDYPSDCKFFTYNDLKTEIPFDCEMIVIPIPGRVVSDAVAYTRQHAFKDPPESFGGYSQIDDEMIFDDASRTVTHIGGEPLDPDRVYQIGVLFMVMTGVDDIKPLVKFAEENPHLFPVDRTPEMGRPAKLLLVDYFSKAIWFQMGRFDSIDEEGKGFVTPEDIRKAAEKHFSSSVARICVNNILRSADTNSDGVVTREELLRVSMMNAWARGAMDVDGSGTLSRSEVGDFIRKQITKDDVEAKALLNKIFSELRVDAGGQIESRHVLNFLSRSFSIGGVVVPGQSLERAEIKAVETRLRGKDSPLG